MVKALHRAGHRGDPRRRLQPHRGGQPPRARCSASRGVDNQSYYRLVRRDAALLHGLHGHRQHAQPRAPERAAADHGLAAVLRDRLPRRRLPLRSRVGARARVLRRRPPLGLLRHHPPGPGALPGEADRRAVGRRPGRLPGRQLPDPLVGVERHLPRRDPRLLARPGVGRASSPRASAAPPISTRPTAGGRSRRSTSSPRTTASRCATSSPTTRSTTRRTARTTATAPTTTAAGTAASKGATDDPAVLALRARQQRNFLATLMLSQGVPMLLGGDEVGADAARQQQRVVPGQRALVARLGERRPTELLEFTRKLIRLRQRAPGLPPDAVLRRHGRAAPGRLVDAPRRAPDDPPRLGRTTARARSACS